jgi:hypothetical protein
VVNDYKLNVLLAGQKNLHVDRSTPLPAPYQTILKEVANLSIGTYGDLSFISQMDPMPDNIIQALQQMTDQGFDRSVLKRIV